MTIEIGFVIDPLDSLNPRKDSSIAMMSAACRRGWRVHTILQPDIRLQASGEETRVSATSTVVEILGDGSDADWCRTLESREIALNDLDIIMMRKDPPFDMEYINTTYMLDHAANAGALVVNHPDALRNCNEKMAITRFPQCCTPMCVSQHQQTLRAFVHEHGDCIIKPLDGMGGAEIFRLTPEDANLSVVLETITRHGSRTVMAQTFIPEISAGDKRILLIDGVPVDHALARVPAKGETRGNLAAGGTGVGVPLTDRDRWICEQIADDLRDRGILFAGIDVIGDYLTEINITSPTCIRELDKIYDQDIASQLMAAAEARLG